jgi:hypothetical protein
VGEPAVGEVVAGHHREHRVREAHALDGLGHPSGLVGGRFQGLAGVDQAEAAGPGAALAEHHERGGAVGPAVAEVGAAGLLAHGDEAELAHRLLERQHLAADLHLRPQPVGLARRDGEARR